MVVRIPTPSRRAIIAGNASSTPKTPFPCLHNQVRNATFIRRPRRPYTFTQLVVLSDGSVYQHRTTSPMPVYKSDKDTRNAPQWNPTSEKLSNLEVDEAGRLAAFRERFGRGWDAKSGTSEEVAQESDELSAYDPDEEEQGGLMDLISGYSGAEEKSKVQEEGLAAKPKGTGQKPGTAKAAKGR